MAMDGHQNAWYWKRSKPLQIFTFGSWVKNNSWSSLAFSSAATEGFLEFSMENFGTVTKGKGIRLILRNQRQKMQRKNRLRNEQSVENETEKGLIYPKLKQFGQYRNADKNVEAFSYFTQETFCNCCAAYVSSSTKTYAKLNDPISIYSKRTRTDINFININY